jgi:hypothetical protein
MAQKLKSAALTQVSFVSGSQAAHATASPMARDEEEFVEGLMKEIGTPPLFPSPVEEEELKLDPALFDAARLRTYLDRGDVASPLHAAVHKARVMLWALSRSEVPGDLEREVGLVRKSFRYDPELVQGTIQAPSDETQFKDHVLRMQRSIAPIMARAKDVYEELQGVAKLRDSEPIRWQANYDYISPHSKPRLRFSSNTKAC